MMNMIEHCRGRLLAVCAVALCGSLGGCASYVSANVTAFQDWQGSDRDRTYTFARAPAQRNDLEQTAYEGLVERELATYGFRRVAEPEAPRGDPAGAPAAGDAPTARYDVGLAYEQRDTVASTPQFLDYGGWGVGGRWAGRGAWGGRGAFGPVPGWAPIVDVPYAASASQLTIRIRERPSGREVYKVSARHDGERAPLMTVMPYLVRSALADFPMPNGTSREVRIPLDRHGMAGAAVVR